MTHAKAATPPRSINLAPLHRLLALAGKAGATPLLHALMQDMKTTQTGLEAARTGPDYTKMRAHSHVLIALAGTVGDSDLHHLAQRLNAAAHDADNVNLEDLHAMTMTHISSLMAALSRIPSDGGQM